MKSLIRPIAILRTRKPDLMLDTHYDVNGFRFGFGAGWHVCRWDDTAFVRNSFCNLGGGSRSCDLVAFEDDGDELWLIEVKDYRVHQRTKTLPLHDEVAAKVRDTLAALWAAQVNASGDEQKFARLAKRRSCIRAVLHLETRQTSRLMPGTKHAADIKMALKRALKAIDPHPVVSSVGSMGSVRWTVRLPASGVA